MQKLRNLNCGKQRINGRNNQGRITIRHRGSGHERLYRHVTQTVTPGIWIITQIIKDPNRTCNINVVELAYEFNNGEIQRNTQKNIIKYKLTADGNRVGDQIVEFCNKEQISIYAPKITEQKYGKISLIGSTVPISCIPIGTKIFNIGSKNYEQGKYLKAAGNFGTISKIDGELQDYASNQKDAARRLHLRHQIITKPENAINSVNAVNSNNFPIIRKDADITEKLNIINKYSEFINTSYDIKANTLYNTQSSSFESIQNLIGAETEWSKVYAYFTMNDNTTISNMQADTEYYSYIKIKQLGTSWRVRIKNHQQQKRNRTLRIASKALATIGQASNIHHKQEIKGKAGKSRHLGIRPHVKGEAMNAVDHPNGGRTRGGKQSKTAWGKLQKGVITARKSSKRWIQLT